MKPDLKKKRQSEKYGGGRGEMDGREFPSIGRKEEVNGVVVEFGLGAQIRVDHLSDRCRPV